MVAMVHGGRLHIANVGDCRAVVVGSAGAVDAFRGLGVGAGAGAGGTAGVGRVGGRRRARALAKPSAVGLSTDHNCDNTAEVRAVLARSGDPRAVYTSAGLKRVCGSLAVTRAIGDFYLKQRDCSHPPYNTHLPYITAEAEVGSFKLPPASSDEWPWLVLASDGLWELLDKDRVSRIILDASKRGEEPSESVLEEALNAAARDSAITRTALDIMPYGRSRRAKHDDITVTVVRLESVAASVAASVKDSAGGGSGGGGNGGMDHDSETKDA